MRQMIEKFRPVAIVAMLTLLWCFTPFGNIPMALLKAPSASEYYSATFFGLLLVGLFVLRNRIESSGWTLALVYSVIGGYLLSIASILSAGLFVQDGLERLSNSLATSGWMNFIAVECGLAGALIGWIVVPMAVACLKIRFEPKVS